MPSASGKRPDKDAPSLTVRRAILDTARQFNRAKLTYGHGTHNAQEEATWLVLHSCGIPFEAFEENVARILSPAEARRLQNLVTRRIAERLPVAYLIREAWLGDFRFYVDRRAIVPRSFIAELLPESLAYLLRRPVRLALDMCTGSACLAILIALAFPKASVDAVDLSSGALAVARKNVETYKLRSRVRLTRSDLFEALPARRYDLIVSNPPYVKSASMKTLPREYANEPSMALAGGDDGLVLVRRILAESGSRLNARGLLVCEIGHNRAALERAYPRVPFTWLDTSAGDRFVFALEKEQLPS